jgi:hypothetical protein
MMLLHSLDTCLYECPYATLGRGYAGAHGQTAQGGGTKEALTLDAPSERNP